MSTQVTPSGSDSSVSPDGRKRPLILGDVGGVQRIDLSSSFKAARVPHKEECSSAGQSTFVEGVVMPVPWLLQANVMTPDLLSCLIMK